MTGAETVVPMGYPLPDVQLRPALLPEADHWRRSCPVCTAETQGGAAGLAAHRYAVHRDDTAALGAR